MPVKEFDEQNEKEPLLARGSLIQLARNVSF
jgi:hypothetical protein